jgi:hypothetical protein
MFDVFSVHKCFFAASSRSYDDFFVFGVWYVCVQGVCVGVFNC